ncbi:MAG: D-alanine--D-alanine ligase [Candidatus Omnitrophica bacterium]|nr:D-alanine--D-alanine ligase [Candidatus Omnitrophota bacterium]
MKIVILAGGDSPEREISLMSGKSVFNALKKKYKVSILDPSGKNFIKEFISAKPDFVFIALHGGKGESGIIQGFLETFGLPYTGSSVLSSAICMNKIISKRLLLSYGIPTPDFIEINDLSPEIPFGYPIVVKPASSGSTIGISIVESEEVLKKAVRTAWKVDRESFIEKFIKGTEITIGILGNEKLQVLPAIEIRTKRKFYDYIAKYKIGGSIHVIPPEIPVKALKNAENIAIKTYEILKCKGFARMEMIIDRYGKCWVLDVNTIPGLTDISLLPDAAKRAGISFTRLCEKLIRSGVEKCGKG